MKFFESKSYIPMNYSFGADKSFVLNLSCVNDDSAQECKQLLCPIDLPNKAGEICKNI